jgi:LEA14-like dessication related protein
VTRFINAVLISVFAFFVFVGVFMQFTGDGAEGKSPGGAPTVTAVDATWQPEKEQEMLLELQVHNPSSLASRVSAVSYKAEVEGRLVDSAVARPVDGGSALVIDGKGDAPVRLPIDLPDDFVLTWWPAYMADGEKADLRIQGTLAIRRDDGSRDVPFEWRSTWQGDLAGQLSDAVANCSPSETDLCLEEGHFFWKEGALHADLGFRNPGSDPIAIRNTTIALLFGDRAVVSGDVDVAQQVRAKGDATVGLALTFSPTAMEAWWPDHLARCERTPVTLRMDLQVEGVDDPADGEPAGNITTLQWTFAASTFQTRFVCAP